MQLLKIGLLLSTLHSGLSLYGMTKSSDSIEDFDFEQVLLEFEEQEQQQLEMHLAMMDGIIQEYHTPGKRQEEENQEQLKKKIIFEAFLEYKNLDAVLDFIGIPWLCEKIIDIKKPMAPSQPLYNIKFKEKFNGYNSQYFCIDYTALASAFNKSDDEMIENVTKQYRQKETEYKDQYKVLENERDTLRQKNHRLKEKINIPWYKRASSYYTGLGGAAVGYIAMLSLKKFLNW